MGPSTASLDSSCGRIVSGTAGPAKRAPHPGQDSKTLRLLFSEGKHARQLRPIRAPRFTPVGTDLLRQRSLDDQDESFLVVERELKGALRARRLARPFGDIRDTALWGGGHLGSDCSLEHRPPTIARRSETRKLERAGSRWRVPPFLMPDETRESSPRRTDSKRAGNYS